MEEKFDILPDFELTSEIEVINPVIDFLKNITEKYDDHQNKLYDKIYKNDNDNDNEEKNEEEYDNKMTNFHHKNLPIIEKTLNKFQNKKVDNFYRSGVIVKSISKKLREDTLYNINNFADKSIIDYHPGSEEKVRDIVHPSLYPYIHNNLQNNKKKDFWNRPYENSKYQWLPSEFKIDNDGKCKIKSYINNLPLTEVNLYKNIEKIFESVLPYFEDIWSYTNALKLYTYDVDFMGIIKKDSVIHKLSLKNKNLQVITKIVKINLKEGQESIGAWHVEGMSHENIIGTVSITLEQTQNFEAELYFKRIYTEAEANDLLFHVPQNPYSELEKILNKTHVPLGKVNIRESYIVAFPNSHIHKINMKNIGNSTEHRTLLVFWLINPNIKIKSTEDISQQNYDLEEAKNHRLELMKERTYYKQTFNQRDLNLCEH
jgi:hypothetical protein